MPLTMPMAYTRTSSYSKRSSTLSSVGAFEDLHGVLERNAVVGNVTSILLRVPGIAHGTIFTLCIYFTVVRNSGGDAGGNVLVQVKANCHRSRCFFRSFG